MSPERVVAPIKRETRQIEPDGAGAGSLADDDVDLEVLHGRIEDLLDRPVETMDLVDEQHVADFEVGEDGGHVGLAFEGRSRRGDDVHAHLVGDDVGQRGLPQPGRARQQHVVERLPSATGRLDEDGELLPQHGLARETLETARPQRAFYLLVVDELFGVGEPIRR